MHSADPHDVVPQPARPADPGRVDALDVLRGFAIFGILIANVLVTSGYFFLPDAARDALPTAATDGVAFFLIHVFVEGKFYSLFSLLFGIGFTIQTAGSSISGDPAARRFRRRLTGLAIIGLLHATLIWAGDILLLYALLGFALLPTLALASRRLLQLALACLALPIVGYVAMVIGGMPDPFAGPPSANGFDPLATMRSGFAHGSVVQVLQANAIQLVGRWIDLFVTWRLPKVLGMFLLGAWIGRAILHDKLMSNRRLLRRVTGWGLGLGIVLNLYGAMLDEQAAYLPATWAGLPDVAVSAVGYPLLALGYAASGVLLARAADGRSRLRPMAAVGRMALTNYLMQSVIMIGCFYGIGLGWYASMGPTETTLLALLICIGQVIISVFWLSRFRFGPVEWLWRRWTRREPVPFRRVAA